MVTTGLCEEGGIFCFALQFGTGCICLVLFCFCRFLPICPIHLCYPGASCSQIQGTRTGCLSSRCEPVPRAQFRKKGCCGSLNSIQQSCHGYSSRLFSCYAKQNSKHRCLTRMSCGLLGTFLNQYFIRTLFFSPLEI